LRLSGWIPWRRARYQELDEEIGAHLRMAEADRVARGESPASAASNARREFGNVSLVKETTREMWGGVWLERLVQDLRYGARMLLRSPGFSILAILCLTVAIGANASVFSWIEGILLRPFPAVAHQERLMAIAGTNRGAAGAAGSAIDLSWPDFRDFQKSCTLFDAFIADRITGATLSLGDRAERAFASVVSANYFQALGVRPIRGRAFEPAENFGRNAHPVAVISYDFWKERFRGDPEIVGKTQLLNGLPHTIVGVAPEGFYGTFVGWAIQLWVPPSMEELFDAPGYKLEDRSARWIEGFVRLKPGVTRQQAQAEISSVAKRLEIEFPATNRNRGVKLFPLWQTPFNNAGALLPTLGIALAVVVFLLLIACANVSNLLLVRAFGRRQEMTIRLAIGAGRGRLLRQLLTEGLILSVLAASGGLVVAHWCRNLLVLLLPPRGRVMHLPGEIDWRVFALSVGVSVISTLVFALVPAFQASRIDLTAALKAEGGGAVGGHGKSRARSGLVLVQVALSFVLLVGAGLLIQSTRRIRAADPGFSARGVLMTGIDLSSAGYDARRAAGFRDELTDRLLGLGGMESAAFARIPPFSYAGYSSAPIAIDGDQTAPDDLPTVNYDEIGPAYFATLGIPLLAGREFTRTDDESAPLVAIVNQAMADQYWHGQDPIGRRLQVKGRWMQVVGVAKMSKYWSLTEESKPFFYVPMRQNSPGQVLLIRTSLGPEALTKTLVREIHALDANLAPTEVITMQEQVDRKTAVQRTAVRMLALFGGLALLLAAVGLYGVMSYSVFQSRREIGLRMALGAAGSDVLRLVMSHGLVLTAAGVFLGAAAALPLTRLIGNLLYKVSPRDPLAFGVALVVMMIVATMACFLPAWRAMRIDPAQALRD
jgi:putative ABC transport system permease protein